MCTIIVVLILMCVNVWIHTHIQYTGDMYIGDAQLKRMYIKESVELYFMCFNVLW